MTFDIMHQSNHKVIIPKENDRTLRKSQLEESKSDSSFDEEEDMPDARDFEEFDRAEESQDS